MDLPRPMFHSFCDRADKRIKNVAKTVCDIVLIKAAKKEQVSAQMLDTNDFSGITVSEYEIWKKKGFKSSYGISALTGFHNDKCLEVIMKYRLFLILRSNEL